MVASAADLNNIRDYHLPLLISACRTMAALEVTKSRAVDYKVMATNILLALRQAMKILNSEPIIEPGTFPINMSQRFNSLLNMVIEELLTHFRDPDNSPLPQSDKLDLVMVANGPKLPPCDINTTFELVDPRNLNSPLTKATEVWRQLSSASQPEATLAARPA